MKGISSIFVMILILVIALALFSMGYIFSTDVLSDILTSTEETLGIQTLRGLAEITIVSINLTANNISIQNSGKVNVSKFNVYVENVLTSSSSSTDVAMPGEFININIGNPLNPGDLVKITTAEGAYAIIAIPYLGDTCADGTPLGECSISKPYYCDFDGSLDPFCTFCGCLSGEACNATDEKCYPVAPPPPIGLVGFWKFDEGSGIIASDSSGNNNDGTLLNGPLWVTGVNVTALRFDGNNDFVRVDDSPSLDTSEITILLWINIAEYQNWQRVIAKYWWSTTGTGSWYMMFNDVGRLTANFNISGSWTNTLTASQIPLNGWTYVGLVYNGTHSIFYINGTADSVANTRDGTISSSTYPLCIATSCSASSSQNRFNGTIDEVQIWNRALSASEIFAEYQKYAVAPPPPPPSDLVGFWKFDENIGIDAFDSSNYKNNGTLNGNPQWVSGISVRALEFDGNGDYVQIPFDSSLQVEPYNFTLAAWIKGMDAQNAENIYVVSLYNDFGFRVAVGGSDNLGMWYRRADSTTGEYNTNHPVLDETFHYIIVTKNGNNYSFYDNGGYVGGTILGQKLMSYNNVRRIGAWTSSYGNFNGTIDEVQIWNRSLNDSEILAEYQKYAPSPPPVGLIGFWALNESSGTIASDNSGNGNDGTLVNGPLWVPGLVGNGLQFDGNNDFVSIPHIPAYQTANGTLMFWIRMNDLTDNTVFSKDESNCNQGGGDCGHLTMGYNLTWLGEPNRFSMRLQNDGNGYWYILASDDAIVTMTTGVWYHVATTFGSTGIRLYINGVEHDYNSNTKGMQNNNLIMYLGVSYSFTRYFNGIIDEVKFYNRALDATEINNEYQKYVPSPPPPQADLIAFWKFDEGSGTTTSDSSGNGHNGVVQASGINQVTNPSFENDKTGWGSGSGTWDIVTDEKYHGSKSSRFRDLTGDSGHEITGNVYIPVTPGQTIIVSLYSKGQNIVQGAQTWHDPRIIGVWLDSDGIDMGLPHADLICGDEEGTWNWKRSAVIHTVPSGAAYYRFDIGLRGNATGTLWVDAVQIDYDNTLKDFTDNPWNSPSYCVEGSCLDFDGYNDYVDVGTFDITSNAMTITAWFKADDFDVGDGRIISKAVSMAEQDHYWMLSTISSGDMRLRSRLKTGGTTTTLIASSGNLFTEFWTHAAFVYNRTHMLLYKNGMLVGSTPKAGAISTNNAVSIWIGDNSGPDRKQFDGVIDEVKIYNRSLSQSEIYQEYQDGVIHWGITSSDFGTSTSIINMRCMGGQAPNKPNMKIKSLNMRFAGTGTAAMALYFGGTESNPNGAVKQVEVLNKQTAAGWNTFVLPSEIDWPANQVTWICWKRSGSAWVYYSGSSLDAGDFYTSHGRHDAGDQGTPSESFPNNLGSASLADFWYASALEYHQ